MVERLREPPWAKSAFDVLRHAYAHYANPGASARRHALTGFDQAIEVVILGYASSVAQDPISTEDQFKKGFQQKLNWLETTLRGKPFPGSFRGIEFRHQLRNRIYHWPTWWVPEPADVEAARRDALAVYEALLGSSVDGEFGHVQELYPNDLGKRLDGKRMPRNVSRNLMARAADLAQQLDPKREGLHYLQLAAFLRDDVPWLDPEAVFDLLNVAQDRFDALGRGRFRWTTKPAETSGMAGRGLALLAWEWARHNDRTRVGLHYDREIKKGLLTAGVAVSGRQTGSTMNAALRNAKDLFEPVAGLRGIYRWLEHANGELGSSR